MQTKNKIYIALASFIAVLIVLVRTFIPESGIDKPLQEIQNKVESQIVITEEMQGTIDNTIDASVAGEDLSTTEIIDSSIEEEDDIADEGALEIDGVVEQENIAYEGGETGNGLSLLGAYQGKTYYSQADSRWANIMYSSIGDRTQTMKSSACGPTSAAMVVSSSKGAILPTTMAELAVQNGYRTANNGTAWAYYPFVADYFDFNEYYVVYKLDQAMDYLETDRNGDGQSDYYIIASCGSGLFTTGGHYIVLSDKNGDEIEVYDPYYYNGKFNTASRRAAKVRVEGTAAYVTESAFRQYANYKSFWVFSNDAGNGTQVSQHKAGERVLVDAPVMICYDGGGDKVIVQYNGNQFWINRSVIKDGNRIYGLADICFASGSSYIVQIFDTQFWAVDNDIHNVSAAEAVETPQSSKPVASQPAAAKYTTGTYKTTANLNVRTGAGVNNRAKKSSELTANARQQNARLGGAFNGYRKGVVCKVTKVSGNWGLTSSGWISLKYCQKQ